VRRLDAIAIIKKEKFLSIFFLLCLLSVFWSYSPPDTVKRFFRMFTGFTVTLSLLVHTTSTKEILKIIKPVLYLYIFLSIVVCILIPGALDSKFHTWQGFTFGKNLLGQVSIICIILSYFIYKEEKGYAKIIAAAAVLFSITLLIGARSGTSITTFLLIALSGLLLSAVEIFRPLGLGRFLLTIIILFTITLIITLYLGFPEILAISTEAIGKDSTFTGRTTLWNAMFISISHHPFLGTGYRAFWSIDPPSQDLAYIYELFFWFPNESHNGYIDIANEVGLIGFGIFVIMMFKYFNSLRRINYHGPWKWIIIAALIIAMQESLLFNPDNELGVMLIVSYMILFAQLWKQDIEVEYEPE
jgi:exopolysaccharide production protein ExoQ